MKSKPISVCLAIYGVSLKGGAEKSVIWLANQLKQHGHRPFILVHESGDVSQTAFPLASGIPVISTQSFQDKGKSLIAKLQLKFMKTKDWHNWDLDQLYFQGTKGKKDLDKVVNSIYRFFSTKTRQELFDHAIHDKFLLAPCNTLEDVLSDVQLKAR